ncbi:MAG: site-specific integrase [Deltaproteobacteria bacterium]|nr:site-specific integrase [Deltaproteobacteria bacterium]
MRVLKAVSYCIDYHKQNSKKNTVNNYQAIFSKFSNQYGDRELESITSDEVLTFLTQINRNTKQTTKRLRYSLLNAFFNLIKNTIDDTIQNPCDTMMLRKVFRNIRGVQWKIFEKEIIDEIIFKTENIRNRLLLELMARGGMRIGEVLKIRPRDIESRKIILHDPKSGREAEVVFIPQKVADRLKEYIRAKNIDSDQRIFPLTYGGAREVIMKAGKLASISLKCHDLRRHAATYASRSGTPIEIVSKVILRHSNLSTTQRYLGKVSDSEAVRWIENLYG